MLNSRLFRAGFARTSSPGLRGFSNSGILWASQKDIQDQVKKDKVVIYMKGTPDRPQCGFSKRAIDALKAEGAKFQSYNVLADDSLRTEVKEFSYITTCCVMAISNLTLFVSGWPTLPQVFIGGDFVGGCDIVLSLQQEGELGKMLKKVGAVEVKEA